MPSDTVHEKQQVHELIDRLAPSQVTAVHGLLVAMLDPVTRAIATAPPDDEPVTDEDRRRFLDGQALLARGGKGVPMEEVLAEFGLKTEDFR